MIHEDQAWEFWCSLCLIHFMLYLVWPTVPAIGCVHWSCAAPSGHKQLKLLLQTNKQKLDITKASKKSINARGALKCQKQF